MKLKKDFMKGYEGFGSKTLYINKQLNPEFQEAIEVCEKNNETFIGSGNPDAEILFIGKEMAIDRGKNNDQFVATVCDNIKRWKEKERGASIVNGPEGNYWDSFSPWFPYYRQNNMIRLEPGMDQKDNGGTSRTEYYYQKIISGIYEIPQELQKFLTLHMYAFQSELSTATGSRSVEVNSGERKKSIENRKVLWKTAFFQRFPITILGIGPNRNYIIRDSNLEGIINIERDFNIRYIGKKIIGRKFINVHLSEDGKRMLLHTSHLSGSSNALIDAIVHICDTYMKYRERGSATEELKKLIEC